MNKTLNLFRAEWQKISGNVRSITFLVWIYPITAVIFLVFFNGTLIASPSDNIRNQILDNPPLWTDHLLAIWPLFNRFPNNMFIRMPFLAFAAVLFAGEYQWGTWKNLLPRNQRSAIILTKFMALGLLIIIALFLTSLIWWGNGWLNSWLVDIPYGPEINKEMLAEFSRTYFLDLAITFVSTLIATAYVALFAMASKSILASMLLSLGVGMVDFASILILMFAGQMFNIPNLANWYVATPSYNLTNITAWINDGVGVNMEVIPGFTTNLTLPQSVLLTILWVIGLVTLTAVLFQRQDIT